MPKDYISREDAISCVKHAWAKGLEPTQYLEELDAIDVACVNFEDKDCDGEQLCACLGIVREKLKKLKEYEDIGLSPEEVKNLNNGIIPNHWSELFIAECEDRLIVLPCKVGGKLWVKDRDGKPRKMVLDAPDIRCHCAKEDNLCVALCDSPNAGVCAYRLKNDGTDFGKSVFLTREEAEKTLERSKTNDKP